MKRPTPLIAASMLIAGASSAFAGSAPAHSYLFTIAGQQAHVRTLSPGHYQLQMVLPGKKQITMFSDRPYRTIQSIGVNQLKTIWEQGNNSFTKNPPNAALTAASMNPEFVTLTRFQLNKKKISFNFSLMNTGTALPSQWTNSSNLHVDITIH